MIAHDRESTEANRYRENREDTCFYDPCGSMGYIRLHFGLPGKKVNMEFYSLTF